jgi:hypothetical protein
MPKQPRKPPLQRAEWKIFGMAVHDAKDRAARGDRRGGYACILAGLQRMEEFVTGGDAWANDLLQAYRRAAKTYDIGGSPPAAPERSETGG